MPFLKTSAAPQTDLYYEDVGRGQPVVMIHGWPLSGRMWEGQVNALVDAGFRCITYDRRGFGMSGKPDGGYEYDTFTSDLRDVLVQLDLREVVLAGFSMGGGEVARYFGRHGGERVAKAVLLGSVTPYLLQTDDNKEGVPGAQFDGMIAAIRKDRVAFLESFFPAFFNWKPGSGTPADDVIAASKVVAWAASPIATQRCVDAFGRTDFRADLQKMTVPTLIVHGDKDQIVPIDKSGARAHDMIAGSRYEVFKGAPHGFNATHGEQLNAVLLDFLGK